MAVAESDVFDNARRTLSVAHERGTNLCDPFVLALPVAGASLSVMSGAVGQSTVSSSNAVAARLDELQFDLGEGPCWQALSTRRPALTSNLHSSDTNAWPVFAHAVRSDRVASDVSAIFAFPLTVGSLDIGAVDLYSTTPVDLTREQIAGATSLAEVAAWQVLRRVLSEQDMDAIGELSTARSSRREVHQATGMVLAQLSVSAEDAALLLRAHAFASGRSVREVATDVVERRLDFSQRGLS
jgi:hypothetical protein